MKKHVESQRFMRGRERVQKLGEDLLVRMVETFGISKKQKIMQMRPTLHGPSHVSAHTTSTNELTVHNHARTHYTQSPSVSGIVHSLAMHI